MTTAEFLSSAARTRRAALGRGRPAQVRCAAGSPRRRAASAARRAQGGAPGPDRRRRDDSERTALPGAPETDRGAPAAVRPTGPQRRRLLLPRPRRASRPAPDPLRRRAQGHRRQPYAGDGRGDGGVRGRADPRLPARGAVLHRGLLRGRHHRLRVGEAARRMRERRWRESSCSAVLSPPCTAPAGCVIRCAQNTACGATRPTPRGLPRRGPRLHPQPRACARGDGG